MARGHKEKEREEALDFFRPSDSLVMKQRGEIDTPANVIKAITSKDQELIIRGYLDDGLSVFDIANDYGYDPGLVKGVIVRAKLRKKAAAIKEDVKEKIFEDKVPVLEAIADNGLVALLEWISGFVESGQHRGMDVDEANKLTSLIEKLHTMYRLQLGKSTANLAVAIEHSSKNMEEILIELRKSSEEGGDPFGNYPVPVMEALPPRASSNGGTKPS